MTIAQKIIDFYFNMNRDWILPPSFELIDPFGHAETRRIFSAFYHKYFSDQQARRFLLGINPGRHGAGVTGVPFTDPKILTDLCDIPNDFAQKHELSAIFIYKVIAAMGGPSTFYNQYYINSVCPLGFLTKGINCNYYDDKSLYASTKPHIVSGIQEQISIGMHTDVAYCLGKGKNYKYLQQLNNEYQFFDKVIPLPHPRWVMQYRRKRVDEFVDEYVTAMTQQ